MPGKIKNTKIGGKGHYEFNTITMVSGEFCDGSILLDIIKIKEKERMAKKKRNLYGDKVIFNGEKGAMLKCPGCGCYTLFSELIWKEGVAGCRMEGCDWKFKITWGEGKKERIYKTKPKGAGEFTPVNYSIPHGKDKDGKWKPWTSKKLKIGDLYDIVTDEHGQEIYITARFVGWKKDVFIRDDGKILPGNIFYLALFEAVGYIEVDTDYSLSITKSEEEGEKRDE